jgi:hypothetical protein
MLDNSTKNIRDSTNAGDQSANVISLLGGLNLFNQVIHQLLEQSVVGRDSQSAKTADGLLSGGSARGSQLRQNSLLDLLVVASQFTRKTVQHVVQSVQSQVGNFRVRIFLLIKKSINTNFASKKEIDFFRMQFKILVVKF